MAPKRRKSASEYVAKISESESYTDFICPICLELLIEPIQLPCKHELCSACFEPHLENASLSCPMCRKRISTWVRDNRKKHTLVNKERWNLIKKLFPERVRQKMEGFGELDTSYDEYIAPKHIIAPEGEVRKDYEVELKIIEQEKADNLKLNLEYIRQLEDEEFEAVKAQEEIDRVTAYALQKEEMENLGVTLKSPTEHQRKLLQLLRPKSPMKLRNHQNVQKRKTSTSESNVLSPKHTITSYFTQSCKSENRPSLQKKKYSLRHSELPCSSKMNDSTTDIELARNLQLEYYSEFDEPLSLKSPKRPLTISNP